MANNYINSIDIGIRLQPKEEVKRELQSMLDDIGKQSTIDIAMNTQNIEATFKDLQKSLDGLRNSISQVFDHSQINTSQISNEVKKTLSQLQKDAIDVFAKEAGLSMGKTLYANFAKSVKQNWKNGEIDKILSDALKINEDSIYKMDKSEDLKATNAALVDYVGFLKQIHVLNEKGTRNGLIVSLQDIKLTKDALAEVQESFKRLVKIDDIKGIRLDRVFGEWADAARSFGLELDKNDALEDKLLAFSRIISEYKNIKKYGASVGSLMSDADEERQIQRITQAYFNLIETLEKIEKTPPTQIAIIDSDKQVKDIKKVENEANHLVDIAKEFKNVKMGDSNAVESVAKSIGNLQSRVGQGISLGDFDDVVKSLQQVNGELVKISNIKIGDGLVRQTTQVEVGIGRVVKEIRNLNVNSDGNIIGSNSVVEPQVIVNLKEYQNAILKIDEAQRKLSELKLVDGNEVTRLKDLLDVDAIGSANELKQYIQEVKQLEKEEQKLQQIQESIIKDKMNMYKDMFDSIEKEEKRLQQMQESITKDKMNMYKDMFDSIEKEEKRLQQMQESITKDKMNMYKDMFDSIEKREKEYTKLFDQADKNLEKQKNQDTRLQNAEYLSSQKSVYKELTDLLKEEYSLKQKLISAEGEYKQRLEESLVTNKLRQNEANTTKDSNNLTSMAKEIELSKERIALERTLTLETAKYNDNKAKEMQKAEAASKKEQQEVQALIAKQIKLLEIKKQGILAKDDKADTTAIDQAIAKYKQLNNMSMKDLKNEIAYINAELKASAGSADTFMEKIRKSLSGIGLYMDVGDVFRAFVDGAKEAVKYVIDVENAMNDLRRIVDMSDESAKTFQQNMHKLSMSLASNSKDTITTVANFAKLGYSLSDAINLGEVATKYNFAADINDIDSATSSLIATLKGFNLNASEAVNITDKINTVSNNFAVTADDVNTALSKSSSTLYTFGNSFEEAVAMNSAIVEITRNADQAGNAIKSIAARLTTNTNALKVLSQMGISIENSNGSLKSTYKLFTEIAEKMKGLQGEALAAAANDLFGKENMSSALALVNNIEQADEMLKSMENSVGSVDAEFNRYLDSTDAKFIQLKENLGEVYSQLINSNMTKGALDMLNGLVSTFGNLPSIISLATTALLVFKGQALTKLIIDVKKAQGELSLLSYAMKTLQGLMATNHLGMIAIACTAAVVGLTSLIDYIEGATDRAVKKFEEIKKSMMEVQELSQQFESLSENVEKFNKNELDAQSRQQFIDLNNQLVDQYPELLSSYDSENQMFRVNIDALKELIKLKEESAMKENATQLGDAKKDLEDYKNRIEAIKKKLEEGTVFGIKIDEAQRAKMLNYIKEYQTKIGQLSSIVNSGTQYINNYANRMYKMGFDAETIRSNLQGMGYELADINEAFKLDSNNIDSQVIESKLNTIKNAMIEIGVTGKLSQDGIDALAAQFPGLVTNADSAQKILSSFKQTVAENASLIKDAANTFCDSGELTTTQVKQLVDAFGQFGVNESNVTGFLRSVGQEFVKIGEDADGAKVKLDELQKAFNSFQGEAELIEQVIKEMQELGGITESTYGKVIGNQNVINALVSEGDAIENLTQLRDHDKKMMQKQIDTAFENAIARMNAEDNVFNNKSENDILRTESDAEANSVIQDNASKTADAQSEAYGDDTSNFQKAANDKIGMHDGVNSALTTTSSAVVSNLGSAYGDDVTNFQNATNDKLNMLDKFKNAVKNAVSWVSNKLSQAVQAMKNFVHGSEDVTVDTSGGGTDSTKVASDYAKKIALLSDAAKGNKTSSSYSGSGSSKGSPPMVANPTKGNGGSKKNGGKKKSDADKARKEAEKYAKQIQELQSNIDVDRYLDLNQALSSINNEMTALKTEQSQLMGMAYENSLIKEIGLLESKKSALSDINDEQKREADELKNYLSQYGFYFDANGQLINSQQRLLEIQKATNAMSGNTEEALKKKQEWVDWVKELTDKTKNYVDLVNSKIPGVTNQFNELGNSIRKIQLNMLETLRDKLVSALHKQAEEKVDKLKKKLEKQQQAAKKALEEEKKAKVNILDTRIEKLRKELEDLDNQDTDKRAKLVKLKEELAKWQKDDSVFAGKKVKDLQEQIAQLEKEIKKDDINKQIDNLQEEKKTTEEYYSEKLDKLSAQHKKELEKNQKKWDKMLSDETAYHKADLLLKEKNMTQITKLLSSYAENFKDIGSLLGTNFADALNQEIQSAMDSLDSIMGNTNVSSGSSSSSNSSSNSSNRVEPEYGESVTVDGNTLVFQTSDGTTTKGTVSENGYSSSSTFKRGAYKNGFYEILNENGAVLGWVRRYEVNKKESSKKKSTAQFASGGRTPDNIDDGALSILHSNEAILNANDTKKLDNIYDFVTVSASLLDRLEGYMALSNTVHEAIMPTPDYNRILGGDTTTNNNNSRTVTIENEINITNNTKNDSYFNARSLEKMFKQQINKFA